MSKRMSSHLAYTYRRLKTEKSLHLHYHNDNLSREEFYLSIKEIKKRFVGRDITLLRVYHDRFLLSPLKK